MDNKDVYDKFNEIDFDVSGYEEIPMDEVEKQRVKKSLKKKLKNNDRFIIKDKNKKYRSKYKVVAVIVILVVLIGISPLGREVIAQISEKLIFTPSQGIIKQQEDKELYMLEEPVRINIEDMSTLVKSITNDGENIYMEMWFDKDAGSESIDINFQKEIKNNLRIKPIDGDINGSEIKSLDVGLYSFASFGYANFSFEEGESLITDFKLCYKDKEIGEFSLKKVDFKNGYDEIGGNAIDKEILLGATSYYQEGERYFKIWSNKDYEELEDYTINLDSIGEVQVKDEGGNIISIESANDGTGKAYKILSDYKGKLYIKIKGIDLGYSLTEGAEVAIKIPRNGETNDINKDLKLRGLEDKIKVTTATNNDGKYTIHLDFSINDDESRTIFMATQNFRSGGAMGDVENKQGEIYLDKEDLSVKERFVQRIYLDINKILIHQSGNWEFIIE